MTKPRIADRDVLSLGILTRVTMTLTVAAATWVLLARRPLLIVL